MWANIKNQFMKKKWAAEKNDLKVVWCCMKELPRQKFKPVLKTDKRIKIK